MPMTLQPKVKPSALYHMAPYLMHCDKDVKDVKTLNFLKLAASYLGTKPKKLMSH